MNQEVFGPYRLEELIGRGGMGEVHRAFDTVHQRTVALKRLRPEFATDAQFNERFRRECQQAARLREAHVVPIHDYGDIGGRLYLDMRLIEGTDLGTLLVENGPLRPPRAVDVVTQVADALDAAHAEGLIHRDVKPSNVLLADAGSSGRDFAYLADFGIAGAIGGGSSLTVTGTTVGTLEYIAPERFQDTVIDQRVDVYSLACVLHEALTGSPPFRGRGFAAMIHAHLNVEPPAPSWERSDIPPGMDAVVARGMAKDPDRRYRSAGLLAAAARAALPIGPPDTIDVASSPAQTHTPARSAPTTAAQGPPASPAPAPPEAVAETRRRRMVPPGLIVLAVLALAVVGVGTGILMRSTPNSAAAAVIRKEPVQTPGDNPFMPPVGTDQPDVRPPPKSGGTFVGDTSGLYGGSLNNAVCDPNAMVAFLRQHPDKADAWAGVEGIKRADIPAYVAELTPMILRSDTAVTNHGFADGIATTVNSVLQAGTAVLVDKYGVPRVRCYCGNPLTPAVAVESPTYIGPTWAAFSPSSVTVIEPAPAAVNEFILVEPATNEVISRPRGSSGEQDRPVRPPSRSSEPFQPAQPGSNSSASKPPPSPSDPRRSVGGSPPQPQPPAAPPPKSSPGARPTTSPPPGPTTPTTTAPLPEPTTRVPPPTTRVPPPTSTTHPPRNPTTPTTTTPSAPKPTNTHSFGGSLRPPED
jgi:tRNA A-37 threonylcarbamoyl transferase component Bud32